MGDSTTTDFEDVIESAMRRIPPESAADPALARNSLGRRDYDQALAHRLAQLKVAMGEQDPPQPRQFAASSESRAPAKPVPHRFGLGTLLLTALISASGGGALALAYLDRTQQVAFSSPVHATAPTPLPITPVPSIPPAADTPPPDHAAEIHARLEAWRADWSRRNSSAYLSHYSPSFVPADGRSYENWAVSRRKNLESRKDIHVALNAVQVSLIDETTATVRFAQDYAAGGYQETGQPKTLKLKRRGAQWLIVGEWQGEPPAPSKR